MISIWDPIRHEISEAGILSRVRAMTYLGQLPFTNKSIELLSTISKKLLAARESRSQAQYVALGYWLRAAALQKMVGEIEAGLVGRQSTLVSRGVALHLPPTNVDTIFVYSWAVSVLSGNCNVVRLPSTLNPGTEWLVSLIASVIKQMGECERQVFCSYPHDGVINDTISANCDLRMIWGGDEKVLTVSKTPIRPDGLSVGFPDRRSYALIDSVTYREISDNKRDGLAAKFFNDIYWFDQMGCGSPRVLFWIGEPGNLAHDFYGRILQQAKQKSHKTDDGIAMAKFASLNSVLASGLATKATHFDNALDVFETNKVLDVLDLGVGGGMLAQTVISRAIDLAKFVDRRTQTIAYFGVETEKLKDLAIGIAARGGYRIVPIGQALQFGLTWDGVDLIGHSTRQIVIA
jgi:hypothetical protein